MAQFHFLLWEKAKVMKIRVKVHQCPAEAPMTGWFFSLSWLWLNGLGSFFHIQVLVRWNHNFNCVSLNRMCWYTRNTNVCNAFSSLQGFLALVSCLSPSSPRMWLHLGARTLLWTVRLKASRPSPCDGGGTASSSRRTAVCASCPTDHCTSLMWGVQQTNQMRASISVSSWTNTEPSWAKDPALQSQVRMEGEMGWRTVGPWMTTWGVCERAFQIEFKLYLFQIMLSLSQNQCTKKATHSILALYMQVFELEMSCGCYVMKRL